MQTSALAQSSPPIAAIDPRGRGGKYLVFRLGGEEFAIEVPKVREIMRFQQITSVPHTPSFVKGVINLRGRVIPVVDLRLKCGFEPEEYSERTCIIVVTTQQEEEALTIGIIVDGVAEVLTLNGADIEDTPDFGPGVAAPYLKGMAKIQGRVKILLDIDEILGTGALNGLTGPVQPGSKQAPASANEDMRRSA